MNSKICDFEDDRRFPRRSRVSFEDRGEELGACPDCGGSLREHRFQQTEQTASGDFVRMTQRRWVCEHWRGPDPRESGKTYEGTRTPAGCIVTVDGQSLEPRLDLAEHSLTGFEWGYGGSGPAQLALAILADLMEDDTEALDLYQDFKRRVIAGIDVEPWALGAAEIMRTVDDTRQERA